MDYKQAELEILEALDRGEITKDSAKSLLEAVEQRSISDSAPDIEERHPDIPISHRLLLRAFKDDPRVAFEKISKSNPHLIFKSGEDGRIRARRPDEKAWKFADPDKEIKSIGDVLGPDALTEAALDVADVAYPLISGGVQTVAGGYGALAGAPAGPIGMTAGAMGAAGAAGAGMEYLRQKIGQSMGYRDETNLGDVVSEGLYSTVAPGILGPGMKTGGTLMRNTLARGMKASPKSARAGAKRSLENWTGGLWGRARGKAGTATGSIISGRPQEELSDMSKNLHLIKKAEKNPAVQNQIIKEYHRRVKSKSKENLEAAGELFNNPEFDDIKLSTDVVLKPLRDLKDDAIEAAADAQRRGAGGIEKKNANKIIKMIDEIDEVPGTILTGQKQITRFRDKINGLQKRTERAHGTPYNPVSDALNNKSKFAMTGYYDEIGKHGPKGELFEQVNKKYTDADAADRFVHKFFKDPQTTQKTIHGYGSRTKTVRDMEVDAVLKEIGAPINETVKKAKVMQVYANPSMNPVSVSGTTSTSISNAPREMAGSLAYAGGGEGSSYGKRRMASGALKFLAQKMGSPWAMRGAARGIKGLEGLHTVLNQGVPGLSLSLPNVNQTRMGLNTWQHMDN